MVFTAQVQASAGACKAGWMGLEVRTCSILASGKMAQVSQFGVRTLSPNTKLNF